MDRVRHPAVPEGLDQGWTVYGRSAVMTHMRVQIVVFQWKSTVHCYAERVHPTPDTKVARRTRLFSSAVEYQYPLSEREALEHALVVLQNRLNSLPLRRP